MNIYEGPMDVNNGVGIDCGSEAEGGEGENLGQL